MSLKAFESLTLLPSRQLHNSRHESQLAKMMSSTAAYSDGHRFLQELLLLTGRQVIGPEVQAEMSCKLVPQRELGAPA